MLGIVLEVDSESHVPHGNVASDKGSLEETLRWDWRCAALLLILIFFDVAGR